MENFVKEGKFVLKIGRRGSQILCSLLFSCSKFKSSNAEHGKMGFWHISFRWSHSVRIQQVRVCRKCTCLTKLECESAFVRNEYLLMLKRLWILLTHTLCTRKDIDAYRLENTQRDTHTHTQTRTSNANTRAHIQRATMPKQTESNQSKCFSCWCFIFAQRRALPHSSTIRRRSSFIRIAKFQVYLTPLSRCDISNFPKHRSFVRSLARWFFVGWRWTLFVIAGAAATADDAKFTIHTQSHTIQNTEYTIHLTPGVLWCFM